MTKAQFGELFYESTKRDADGNRIKYKVKSRLDLDARLVQDIIGCNIRGEMVETEAWLLRFLSGGDAQFREAMDAAIERLRHYLDPRKNYVDVMWEHNVVPTDVAELAMEFLVAEEIFIKPPVFIEYRT